MAKTSQKSQKTTGNSTNNNGGSVAKVKRTRKSVPRDSPPQRSSIFRGVTRHRWTGRYEAHLWDKNCWNESQNKKGRQVLRVLEDFAEFMVVGLVGAYDDEEAAAHAYDLAALKYWGQETILNFPLSAYQEELKEMEGQSKEEYIGSLRRQVSLSMDLYQESKKSSGFSRGVSKYRGVARHHHNGRWEARIGRVFGNKYLYLGTYATQEEAATAYDMAAIEYRGLNAVTNFDLSRYIKWLRPNQSDSVGSMQNPNGQSSPAPKPNPSDHELGLSFLQQQHGSDVTELPLSHARSGAGGSGSGGGGGGGGDCPLTPPDQIEMPRSSFPDDIQTYFDCQETNSYGESDDIIFGDLKYFSSPMFQCELDT
ncbi:AP2-like ethylene-responsive transcription factor [Vitis vinifera]|uniref:AP2-like ethylene-responsive transcription factor n=1 Tax=Vitis vinifera TaxID=29760 RepID=A0A438HY05_VITVI|nr:AP2-like ethylene-responsive transcription factor [Vitis vinifera]